MNDLLGAIEPFDHNPFVDATAEPTRTEPVWAKLGWAPICESENQNMDLVPPYFDRQLSSGCPECGAAWQELLAVGFTAPRMYLGEVAWEGGDFNVSTPAQDWILLRAVRVRCHSSHSFDFDSYTGCHRKHEAMPWGLAMASVALAGYLLAVVGSR